ncbi:hypothetical protein, partial [Staphylococcus carnosus]
IAEQALDSVDPGISQRIEDEVISQNQ